MSVIRLEIFEDSFEKKRCIVGLRGPREDFKMSRSLGDEGEEKGNGLRRPKDEEENVVRSSVRKCRVSPLTGRDRVR